MYYVWGNDDTPVAPVGRGHESSAATPPPLASEIILLHDEPCGPLLTEILKRHSLTWENRLRLCHQVAAGLSHLHSLGLVHGALTTSAVRIDDSKYDAPVAKLIGFDLQRYLAPLQQPTPGAAAQLLKGLPITPKTTTVLETKSDSIAMKASTPLMADAYWSPERLLGADTNLQRPSVDMYTLGCLISTILTGIEPKEIHTVMSLLITAFFVIVDL